ncbi:hypothetical protein C1637_05865 [Chryseobacterium lactis]|uniref:Lipoprotein n=1 Tax=Chryseobacterium lactis TaxID=1241981 RepID=A0A3G6RIW4_CHRLC|nr:hypothetical protein [Chryseobacterium lactis]AZA84367.1 hypothetical protein EG342_21835 [Chryseobacterium lactis]AZB04755.1 hypothetical protein EG341_12715 [Chryseobacterium lactis]PNW14485.1 hypothetical protein C1637_05865 [Chryseobacterium lactis]
MRKKKISYISFLIILMAAISFTMTSCSGRDEDVNTKADDPVYKVEIKYTGDLQNWEEKLSVSTSFKDNVTPTITGVSIDSSQKISDTGYIFTLPVSSPSNKTFKTSSNVIGISINGNITKKNSNAGQLTATVKVYKNNAVKFESPFVFDSTNTYPYYNINVD